MPSVRHLTPDQVSAALRRNGQIEQLLGSDRTTTGQGTVRWLTLGASGGQFALRLHVSEDVGSDDFVDVSEFPSADPDDEYGEGTMVASGDDLDEVMMVAVRHGASPAGGEYGRHRRGVPRRQRSMRRRDSPGQDEFDSGTARRTCRSRTGPPRREPNILLGFGDPDVGLPAARKIGQSASVSPDAEQALASLRDQGYEVRLQLRDLNAELMAQGEPGRASFYAAGRDYWCVDLLSDGVVAWSQVSVGETEEIAVIEALRWFTR